MIYIWELQDCFVKDIVSKFPQPAPPYTTVASIVKNLERKGYVKSKHIGNTYQYTPAIRENEYKRHFMSGVVRNYFENSRVIEYNTKGKSKNLPEAPRIYKSRVNPGVIVYEYENRYDLYEQSDGRLVLVKTEWKKGKGRR